MTAQKGSEVLIRVGDGGGPEIFTILGGLQVTRCRVNNQRVDATNLGSGAWRALLAGAGVRSISLSCSGIFTDAASEETVRSHAFAGTINNYAFDFGGNDTLTGPFQVAAYERAGDHDGVETYAVTFESAGPVVATIA